jgi:hypothetical protein
MMMFILFPSQTFPKAFAWANPPECGNGRSNGVTSIMVTLPFPAYPKRGKIECMPLIIINYAVVFNICVRKILTMGDKSPTKKSENYGYAH